MHFQDELAVDSAGVKHAVDLAELHSCAAPTRPFASARASETVSPSSAKGPPTAFSFSVLLCRVQWERGRRKGFSPILIPFHGSFPKGVSSLYLNKNKTKQKYSWKRFYLRKVEIGKQRCPLTSGEERQEKSQMHAGRSSRRAKCPRPSTAAARGLD